MPKTIQEANDLIARVVNVIVAPAVVLEESGTRRNLLVQNQSDTTIFVGFGTPTVPPIDGIALAAIGVGGPLNSSKQEYSTERGNMTRQTVWAWTTVANKDLLIMFADDNVQPFPPADVSSSSSSSSSTASSSSSSTASSSSSSSSSTASSSSSSTSSRSSSSSTPSSASYSSASSSSSSTSLSSESSSSSGSSSSSSDPYPSSSSSVSSSSDV